MKSTALGSKWTNSVLCCVHRNVLYCCNMLEERVAARTKGRSWWPVRLIYQECTRYVPVRHVGRLRDNGQDLLIHCNIVEI